MKTPRIIVSLSTLSLLSSIAFADGLGPANGYTIFTIESFQANNTDCTGRVAVGGPATYNNFGIGSALEDSDGTRDDLIVAGNLTWNNGQNFNGNVQVAGPVTMNNVGMPNGIVSDDVSIDFTAAETELMSISSMLFAATPNGVVSNTSGFLSLVGTDSEINIFSVSQNDLSPLKGITINVPQGSSVLVNIDHNSLHLKNFELVLIGCSSTDILFNAPETNSIQVSQISWKGTILAPNASIQFNNGQIDGALVCRSIQGNGESHHAPFDGQLPGDDDDLTCDCTQGEDCDCNQFLSLNLYD